MKRIFKLIVAGFVVLSVSSTMVLADGASFTPLNFDDSNSVKTPVTTTSKTVSGVEGKKTDLLDPAQVTGGSKMQDAILQIDNAQVELRNKLLNYKSNYSEIDSKYESIKIQRKDAKRQVKQAEKKIKNLDKAKEKIRKNFERGQNL